MQVDGKKMIASGNGGSIVNISSVASKGAFKGMLAYSVRKLDWIWQRKYLPFN